MITGANFEPIPIPYPSEFSRWRILRKTNEIFPSDCLVHNHPSGDSTPSRADIAMTREIAAAAKALKIELHDHLVIGRGNHASFKALGLL